MDRKFKLSTSELLKIKLPPKGSRPVDYADDKVQGLIARIHPSGTISFIHRYTFKGVRKNQTLGRIPNINATNARNMVLESLKAMNDPFNAYDPYVKRKEEELALRNTPTIRDLGSYYLEYHSDVDNEQSTYRSDKNRLENHIYPEIGEMFVNELEREDVKHLFLKIGKKLGLQGTANKVLSLISSMYNQGLYWREFRPYIKDNPAKGIKHFPTLKRNRYLTKAELEKVVPVMWSLATKHSGFQVSAQAICFMLFTGARRGRALSIKWDEIMDHGNGVKTWVSAETNVTKLKPTVPLNEYAVKLLEYIQNHMQQPYDNPYVFPGHKRATHLKEPKKAWVEIQEEVRAKQKIDISDVCLHDLRRTFGCTLLLNGVDIFTVSQLLGHKSVKTTQDHYAFLSYEKLQVASQQMSNTVSSMLPLKL